MRKIKDALRDLNEYSRKADEALRALPAPDPACHVCVTDLRLSVIEEFLACMFPEWTVDVTFQHRPSIGERIKAFYVQRIRRGSHGPLSSEMRWSPEMWWSSPRYRRVSLFLSWRLHAWFPFLFRPRRYGTLPDQMGTSHIKKIEVPRD